jgi:ER-bound oxygenase mpaB/B'/Rubber oxygenase, catalytic domain
MTHPSSWLNALRAVGDPPVDELVARFPADAAEAGAILRRLFESGGMSPGHPLIAAYAQMPLETVDHDPEQIERGQQLFQLFAPEILLVLGASSLPLAYAAGDGVQVVHRARRLKEEPIRRLCDTAQMVINVMRPGQLVPGGVGWNSARKVRLVHALVRRSMTHNPAQPWDADLGVPINQEDLAGTLLSFSVVVLDGLGRMGAQISSADASAFMAAWAYVGRLLGMQPELTERLSQDPVRLAREIGARQYRATPEGRELVAQLLGAIDTLLHIPGYAAGLSRFFLEDSVFGDELPELLAIPRPNWSYYLLRFRAMQKRSVLRWLPQVPGAIARRRFLAKRLAQAILLRHRPDARAHFNLAPDWLTA